MTNVTFLTESTNLDYLIGPTRLQFGDLTGSTYSDTIIRTAIAYGIDYLQNRWAAKYQIFWEEALLNPQPSDVPTGYKRINTADGVADIPETLVEGSVFRNPYIEFTQDSPPIIANVDRPVIISAAVYMLRRSQVSSSSGVFISWSTEDIRYSNLGSERSLTKLLADDLDAINNFFGSRLGKSIKSTFPPAYIPVADI